MLRAEQVLGQRLRDLCLPGSGWADEQEDAEWPRRVGKPGLHHRHTLDETIHRLGLTEHAALEEPAQLAQVECLALVENASRQTGQVGERGDHVSDLDRRQRRVAAQSRACLVEQRDEHAGRLSVGEVLLREMERLPQSLVRELDAAAGRLPVAAGGERLVVRERQEPDSLKSAASARVHLSKALELGRLQLPQQPDPPGLDVRE